VLLLLLVLLLLVVVLILCSMECSRHEPSRDRWNMQSWAVNAYYDNTVNSVRLLLLLLLLSPLLHHYCTTTAPLLLLLLLLRLPATAARTQRSTSRHTDQEAHVARYSSPRASSSRRFSTRARRWSRISGV